MVRSPHEDDKRRENRPLSGHVSTIDRAHVRGYFAETAIPGIGYAVAFGAADYSAKAWTGAPGEFLLGVSSHRAEVGEEIKVYLAPSQAPLANGLTGGQSVEPGEPLLLLAAGTWGKWTIGDPTGVRAAFAADDTSALVGQLDAFTDMEVPVAPLIQRISGDTDDFAVDTTEHTIWTYAETQAVLQFPTVHLELFVASTSAGDTHQVRLTGTRAGTATVPYEEFVISRTLSGQTPVSLFATPGSIGVEDPMICRQVVNLDDNNAGEIFVGWDVATGSNFSGGVPPANQVLVHLPVARGVSAVASYTIPGGFNAGIIELLAGNHQDGDVWIRQIRPGPAQISYDSFKLPLPATTFASQFAPRFAGGSAISPSFFAAGDNFMLMIKAEAGGAGTTIAGGEMAIELVIP